MLRTLEIAAIAYTEAILWVWLKEGIREVEYIPYKI
jgi:hypothetical protein